jgi:hypothetical protein
MPSGGLPPLAILTELSVVDARRGADPPSADLPRPGRLPLVLQLSEGLGVAIDHIMQGIRVNRTESR